jgi:membrane-associated phospholipid phosphatase
MKRQWILFISSSLQMALFALLAGWVSRHPQTLKEIVLTRVVQRKQTTLKRRLVKVLSTATGSAIVLNLLVVPVAFLLWRKKFGIEALMAPATLWSNSLIRTGIKGLIGRPRPKPLLVRVKGQAMGKSFPSGHVASSINFWGWLFTVAMFRKEMNQALRNVLLGISPLFIALVGPTRVYLGDHWTTDVLGGYLFGGGWFGFSVGLYLKLRESGAPD